MTAPYAPLGTISHGTMQPDDLIPEFAAALRQVIAHAGNAAGDWSRVVNRAQAFSPEHTPADEADSLVSDLFDALQAFAPPYAYFGAHPGDGSDYGFWLSEDWEQQARDDGVLFVSDLAEIPEDFRGGSIVVVNDHGNATYYEQDYTGTRREVWSVV